MLLPPSEIDHAIAVQFVGGNVVGDCFHGSRHGLADGVAHALENALHGLGLCGDVVVHGLDWGLGHESECSEFATLICMNGSESWPALPLNEWQDTYTTLHMWTQIVGKIRMKLSPPINHWWHTTLYVNARGLTTGLI